MLNLIYISKWINTKHQFIVTLAAVERERERERVNTNLISPEARPDFNSLHGNYFTNLFF
jgi:hypothetical protein